MNSPARSPTSTFRSLKNPNYRLWAMGAFVSNIGTWMQRTAQDWIVLKELTNHNATAVGIVMGLQYGPQALMLPWSGSTADHFDRRKLLMITQGAMGALALGLGLLTVTKVVTLWEVYLFAFALGCVTAFDAPARQTFVSDLVGDADLSNAVALNSTSFNSGRLIGPAVAGVLIAAIGTGWVFLANAASFVGVLIALVMLDTSALHIKDRGSKKRGNLAEGMRYVAKRPDLKTILLMFFVIGTFGANFPIYISTMSVTVFHAGASRFGLLASFMAIGSVSGALLAARREKPRISVLIGGCLIFGVGLALAAVMPNYWLFGVMLISVGIATQTFTTGANSSVQLSTDPNMRGRVLSLLLAIGLGGTPIGAPIVGFVADKFGARWGVGVGASSGFVSALVGILYLVKHQNLRVRLSAGRLQFDLDPQLTTKDPV